MPNPLAPRPAPIGGVKLHPQTGLPEYPRGTAGIEGQLAAVGQEIVATGDALIRTLAYLEDQFTEAFEAEESRAATRARINNLAARKSRGTDFESQQRARLQRRG